MRPGLAGGRQPGHLYRVVPDPADMAVAFGPVQLLEMQVSCQAGGLRVERGFLDTARHGHLRRGLVLQIEHWCVGEGVDTFDFDNVFLH